MSVEGGFQVSSISPLRMWRRHLLRVCNTSKTSTLAVKLDATTTKGPVAEGHGPG